MRYRYIHYNLDNGFINNWLVAGPQTIPIELNQFSGEDIRKQIAQHFYDPESGITKTPIERGPLDKGLFQIGDYSGSWNYYACQEDHLIDHSNVYSRPQYLRSWAYTQLPSKSAQEVILVLTSFGPTDVWLNGQHIHRQDRFSEQQAYSTSFKVYLVKGINKIIVRFEGVVDSPCAHAVALQVCTPTDSLEPYPARTGIHISLPSLIQSIARRNTFERVSASAYLSQDIYEGKGSIYLHWPADLEEKSYTTVRLIASNGQFYAEADVNGTPGDKLFLGYPPQIPEGPSRVVLMPRPWEFYEKNLRITREIPFWNLGKSRYSSSVYGTYAERREEALITATERSGLFAEIAKMALQQWESIETETIISTVKQASLLEVLGLLGIVYRFSNHADFPEILKQPIEECILNYPYPTIGNKEGGFEFGESHEILSLVCEILAGQHFPERIFLSSGKLGQWHRDNGERLVLEWLHQRGATGFSDWDSNVSFAETFALLSYLIDLAKTESVWEMASVVMDKLFLTIAINSFQGVFGSTHGRTNASSVKGGLLEPTSGITRMMWGTGIFNHHIAPVVSLACMENYELPALITDIALAMPEEMWDQEQHAVDARRVVNKVTYKCPEYMLCSAQDYYPGEKGHLEHIWQATLGAAATIFVTHPACSSEADARQPNFWAGNAILPRVAQWKDVLIASYHLPSDDWMGFTHAYFPTYALDEYALLSDWAFARKGQGYLAITASQGLSLVQRGQYAFRELRSYGQDIIWLCHMGRGQVDGDFKKFQDKILSLNVEFHKQSVKFATLRGETLSFGWQGPFLRDDQEQPLSNFEQYLNPYVNAHYPSKQMDIQIGEDLLRLDFEYKPDVS